MDSNWQNSYTTIQEANLYLLNSGTFTDVTFVVGDEKEVIEAHKLILMARSPVFETMFQDRWETGPSCPIEISATSGNAFQLFLKFLYGNEFAMTANEAAEVIHLARRYDSKELVTKCSDLLQSELDIDTAIQIHQVAKELDQKALETNAMEFILKNGKQVVEDIGFLEMDLLTLQSILQNDNLVADELTVFRAVMRWADNECDVKNLSRTIGNNRIVLKDVIHLIRFPTMSLQEFTDEVIGKHDGILTDSEAVGIYRHFTTTKPRVQSGVPELQFSKTRRLPNIYFVKPYVMSEHVEKSKSCRLYFGRGSAKCQTTFQFTTNRSIRVTAIEFFIQDPGTPPIWIYVCPSDQPMEITSTIRRPASSIFDLKNGGIDVVEGVPCVVRIKSSAGTFDGDLRITPLASSVRVNCGEDSTTFTFSASSGNCDYGERCISAGQICKIHFTV